MSVGDALPAKDVSGLSRCQDTSVCIWHFGSVSSGLDVAYRMALHNKLNIWDSVLAREQRAGRGQMRRVWVSPVGNLYASLRLPLEEPFTTDYVAPAFGCLIACALEQEKIAVRVKWPNDILGKTPVGYAKFGGILLEERGNILLAGIGINVASYPEEDCLREDHLYPATSLKALQYHVEVDSLWKSLVVNCLERYAAEKNFAASWRTLLAPYLVDGARELGG